MADGRWPMADGRWPMADGRWPMAVARTGWRLATPPDRLIDARALRAPLAPRHLRGVRAQSISCEKPEWLSSCNPAVS
jgi:2-amino-4-hydroxy-6-hydroxymethyldihydropteridine diphosphokinase